MRFRYGEGETSVRERSCPCDRRCRFPEGSRTRLLRLGKAGRCDRPGQIPPDCRPCRPDPERGSGLGASSSDARGLAGLSYPAEVLVLGHVCRAGQAARLQSLSGSFVEPGDDAALVNHSEDEADDEGGDDGEDGVHGCSFLIVRRVEINIPAPMTSAMVAAGTSKVSFSARKIGGTREIPIPIKRVRFPIGPGMRTIATIPAKIARAPAKLRGHRVAATWSDVEMLGRLKVRSASRGTKGRRRPPEDSQAVRRPAVVSVTNFVIWSAPVDPAPRRRACSRDG